MPSVKLSLPTSLFLPDVLKRTIVAAGCEDRLHVGLDTCIDHLNTCDPLKILAVVFIDSAELSDRFSQTILETYCYEQSIPFMKTDLRVMRRILRCIQRGGVGVDGFESGHHENSSNPSCIIIMRSQNDAVNSDEIELVKAINLSEMNDETLMLANTTNASSSSAATTPTSPNRKIT